MPFLIVRANRLDQRLSGAKRGQAFAVVFVSNVKQGRVPVRLVIEERVILGRWKLEIAVEASAFAATVGNRFQGKSSAIRWIE